MNLQRYRWVILPAMLTVLGSVIICVIYTDEISGMGTQRDTLSIITDVNRMFDTSSRTNGIRKDGSTNSSLAANSKLVLTSMFNPRRYNSNHIVYLKVHKAASSTIQSIIMKAGMKRDLIFALPPRESKTVNQLGWPGKFNRNRNLSPEIPNPEVLCYHAVLSDDLIRTMPNDSFYFTSLRDPFTQIKSTFTYYSMSKCLQGNKPASLLDLIKSGREHCAVAFKNPQAFDLGLSMTDNNKHDVVLDFVERIDKLFHFVMIVEYFDECLILLRDMLGWATEDVLYFKTNFKGKTPSDLLHYQRQAIEAAAALLPEDNKVNRAKVYKFLSADYSLYSHFRTKLEKVIAAKKNYLEAEIVKLHQLQDVWMAACVREARPSRRIPDRRFRPYGSGSYGYVLTAHGEENATCVDLAMVEIPHVKKLAVYQDRLLNKNYTTPWPGMLF